MLAGSEILNLASRQIDPKIAPQSTCDKIQHEDLTLTASTASWMKDFIL